MTGWMLYVHALSPLHSGTGSATGVIDLPVARERVTRWPYLPGSSLKGVLRDAAEAQVAELSDEHKPQGEQGVKTIFGPDTQHADDGAGAVWFADAHLLCLPVRSFQGTFAWVTCRLALERWQRDRRALDRTVALVPLPPPPPAGAVHLAVNGTLDYTENNRRLIALEDIDLPVQTVPPNTDAPALAAAQVIADAVFPDEADDWWRGEFEKRFAVVDDDMFTQLAVTATEVVARIRLDEKSKTVASGALWYEEAVPAEAIFASPLGVDPRYAKRATSLRAIMGNAINNGTHQIGGHAGVGRGLVRLRLS